MVRRAFTLVEMLVVLVVVLAIMGTGIPIYRGVVARAKLSATRALVPAVAAAIEAYGARTLPCRDPADPRRIVQRRLWDLDGDGLIDGRPDLDPAAAWPADALDAGYRGFLDAAQFPAKKRNVDAKRRIVDGWGRPLRIAFAAGDAARFAPSWFGVWSAGPDGLSDPAQPATLADDITSWESPR